MTVSKTEPAISRLRFRITVSAVFFVFVAFLYDQRQSETRFALVALRRGGGAGAAAAAAPLLVLGAVLLFPENTHLPRTPFLLP